MGDEDVTFDDDDDDDDKDETPLPFLAATDVEPVGITAVVEGDE